MVCGLCATGTGKTFESETEVKTVNIDLDTRENCSFLVLSAAERMHQLQGFALLG
jgi:hypothetical protein